VYALHIAPFKLKNNYTQLNTPKSKGGLLMTLKFNHQFVLTENSDYMKKSSKA
jgi:hypothetical protein